MGDQPALNYFIFSELHLLPNTQRISSHLLFCQKEQLIGITVHCFIGQIMTVIPTSLIDDKMKRNEGLVVRLSLRMSNILLYSTEFVNAFFLKKG